MKSDRWHVSTANGTIEARYLIAADGAAGSMRQWLGFKHISSFPKGDRCLIAGATFRGNEPKAFSDPEQRLPLGKFYAVNFAILI